jgi:hypothetical protein
MLRARNVTRFFSTSTPATSNTTPSVAQAPSAAIQPAQEYFSNLFQVKSHPGARYVTDNKPYPSVVPTFARDDVIPWAKRTHDLPNIGVISGTPKEYLNKQVTIRKNARHVMQSGSDNEHYWKIVFPRSGNWVNQLMGWISGGDSLQATGAKLMKFDSSASALAFAKKMGWTPQVAKDNEKQNMLGKKAYDHNFLNVHVKKVIQVRSPPVTMKSQFGHPERGKSSWVNLGQMAVQMKTSTHFENKKVEGVSQAFWDSKDFDKNEGAKGWRYDNDFERTDELSRKLGK